jgi:predicted patatin/cPLA2 family phospholipase
MSNTALVLEGGGMRGIFTAGVLDLFIDKGLTFDNVTGVSAGAGHAVSYLSGQRGRAFDVCAGYVSDKRYCSLQSLFKTGDLFGADFIYREIPEALNPYDYDAYLAQDCTFRAVITDCETGRPEYAVIRDVKTDMDYVRASASLPFVSRTVDIGGGKFLDGGISDPIPFEHMLELGCDKVIVVLTRPYGYRKRSSASALALAEIKYGKYPALAEALRYRHLVYNDSLDLLEELEREGKVFVIRPPVDLGIGRTEKNYDRLKRAYKIGYGAAKSAYKSICKFLEA